MQDEVFLVCWDRDRGRPGGRMIPCGYRLDVDGWGGRAGVGFHPSDGNRTAGGEVGAGLFLSYVTISDIA